MKQKRKLIRDWQPTIPQLPHRKGFAFSNDDMSWTPERKDWLRDAYPDAENWRLAQRLNTTELSVTHMARNMHLQKSANFLRWEHSALTKEPGVPAGWHWETDEEFQQRLAAERMADERRARAVARGFDFCTDNEKEQLVAVLVEAIEWGRWSQPDIKYDFEYWN